MFFTKYFLIESIEWKALLTLPAINFWENIPIILTEKIRQRRIRLINPNQEGNRKTN